MPEIEVTNDVGVERAIESQIGSPPSRASVPQPLILPLIRQIRRKDQTARVLMFDPHEDLNFHCHAWVINPVHETSRVEVCKSTIWSIEIPRRAVSYLTPPPVIRRQSEEIRSVHLTMALCKHQPTLPLRHAQLSGV
jgi:hypothetical protein